MLTYVKLLLDNLDPKAWYLAVSGLIWLVVWAWRRYLPALYVAMAARGPVIAQLPMLVLGALLTAAPAIGSGIAKVVQETIIGAVLTALNAQGINAALKSLPVPYNGASDRVAAARAFRALPSERPTPPSGPSAAV